MGLSFGGYLAPRAAAYEHRIAAFEGVVAKYPESPEAIKEYIIQNPSAFDNETREMAKSTDQVREGYITVTGGRVWYQIVGSGDGVSLLVLHGGPGVPHYYVETLEALSNERPVIFYDQPGCGKSDRPDNPSLPSKWRPL